MTPDERSRLALQHFDALADLEAVERAAELSRIEDTELRAQVTAMLEADANHSGVLERTVTSLLPSSNADEHPARIGPWRITGIAGRGGMGAVYLGERDDGQFHQRAAIKLIRVGMDTPQLRARFLRERQILAALKHPHIATLLDGGVTETGAPYFAMQHVEGEPLDTWADSKKLTLRHRVELFLQVCAAVQHAHQNLIVHRDLKPANILIDGDGQAKLLDFGIAKLLDTDSPDATRERPHTPDYAAPEQVAGGTITTATDVYGLGVVLHGLLCGRPPRESNEPLSRAVTNASEETARARGVSSKKQLARELRGDLSAIVQQCLHEAPSRRYASVNALAEDLRAWLDGRPVKAQPPTRGYLLRKFIARNRFGVAAAFVLVLAVVGGVAGVLWQSGKAHKSAAEAQAQLAYLGNLLEVLAPSTAEARELDRSKLIAEAATRAKNELKEPSSLAGVEFALAQVALRVGDYPQSLALADEALALRRQTFGEQSLETAEAAVFASTVRLVLSPPRYDEAAALLDDAITFARREAPRSTLLVSALQKRGSLYQDQAKFKEQAKVMNEAAALCETELGRERQCEEVWISIGAAAALERKPENAVGPYKRAIAARTTRLGAEHANTLNIKSMLAWAQAEAGDLDGGLKLAEEVHASFQRIFTKPTETSLRAQLRLARLLKRARQQERAEALVDDYIVHAERIFGPKNSFTMLGYSDRASLMVMAGRWEDAAKQFGVVAETYRAMKSEANVALAVSAQADAVREAGRPAEAKPLHLDAIATMRKVYPGGEHLMLGRALASYALTEAALGNYALALELHSEAAKMLRKLQGPGATYGANEEAFLGRAMFDVGKKTEGEVLMRAAVKELEAHKEDAANQYWEPFALLTGVACANQATDCEVLKQTSRDALKLTLAGSARTRLKAALGEP